MSTDLARVFGGISGADSYILDSDRMLASVRFCAFLSFVTFLYLSGTPSGDAAGLATSTYVFALSWLYSIFYVSNRFFLLAVGFFVFIYIRHLN
jgi:hypothetical protein